MCRIWKMYVCVCMCACVCGNIVKSFLFTHFFLFKKILNINLFIFFGGWLVYNIVLVLSYINMNLPRLYTCSPSWTPSYLPPHTILQIIIIVSFLFCFVSFPGLFMHLLVSTNINSYLAPSFHKKLARYTHYFPNF